MRQRIRPAYSADELYNIYSRMWDGTDRGTDPVAERVRQVEEERDWIHEHEDTRCFQNTVVGFGRGIGKVRSIADMSCGSGDIARMLAKDSGIEPILGDLGPGYPYHGTLQETVPLLPVVDLFIFTETAEHLDDPAGDLILIRQHTSRLLMSTPDNELSTASELAVGHYWNWDREGVEELLIGAGFQVQAYVLLDMTPRLWGHCKFGVWSCI